LLCFSRSVSPQRNSVANPRAGAAERTRQADGESLPTRHALTYPPPARQGNSARPLAATTLRRTRRAGRPAGRRRESRP
jgi:hypothetical protein